MRDQHGLVARRQLRSRGVAESTIDAWVQRGVIAPVDRGVYRHPAAPRTDEQTVMAAVLRCGPDARAGGWTACALYGLEGSHVALRPWLLIPPERRVRARNLIVQRSRLEAVDRAVVHGIPATSPRRSIVDAARRLRGRRLRVAVDDARRRGLMTLEELLDLATALRQHRGAVRIRELFGSGALDQDGEAERWLARALAARDVYPIWSPEVLPGVFPDAVLPEAALVIECDGADTHTLPVDRADDASREALLRVTGWHVERASGRELAHDPSKVVDRILTVRRARIADGRALPSDWQPLTPGRRLRP